MMRTLLAVGSILGLATAASAATLTVSTETLSAVPQNTFLVGETFILKVIGDAQGGLDNAIYGELRYDAAITTTIAGSQSSMFPYQGVNYLSDGLSVAFDQNNGSHTQTAPSSQILTATLTLIADAPGVSQVHWRSSYLLDFFNIYMYEQEDLLAHTFTIIPEPAAAALLGLGLLGLALRRRRPRS